MTQRSLFETRAVVGSATISPCGLYRYELRRTWGDGGRACNAVMLNPSKATAEVDDPTVTRMTRRARDWGYDVLIVTNLFAFRATNPADMMAAADPIGPENDAHIARLAREASLCVCAWGTGGSFRGRGAAVAAMLRAADIDLHWLRGTQDGHPRHPLYVAYAVRPERWPSPAG